MLPCSGKMFDDILSESLWKIAGKSFHLSKIWDQKKGSLNSLFVFCEKRSCIILIIFYLFENFDRRQIHFHMESFDLSDPILIRILPLISSKKENELLFKIRPCTCSFKNYHWRSFLDEFQGRYLLSSQGKYNKSRNFLRTFILIQC